MATQVRGTLALACVVLSFPWIAGRIEYPDDEVMFQTAQSLVERGELVVEGVPPNTGLAPRFAPEQSFGTAAPLGPRYSAFGVGLPVIAAPLYALASATSSIAPRGWVDAPRGDLLHFEADSSFEGRWQRMVVTLTNLFVVAALVVVLHRWLMRLGYDLRAATTSSMLVIFGSSLFAYSGSFMSEPTSALCLVGSAWLVDEWRAAPRLHTATLAGLLAGASVWVHVLNVLALPPLLLYAMGPPRRSEREVGAAASIADVSLPSSHRAAAILACGLLLGALGWSQWARFGHPFETGRFDWYATWQTPGEAWLAFAISPGRGLLWFSPILLLALPAWPKVARRRMDLAVFVALIFALRVVLVSLRTDWFGGWTPGPRYLLPLVPFLALPLAEVVTAMRSAPTPRRVAFGLAIAGVLLVSTLVAAHSSVEWMWGLQRSGLDRDGLYAAAHWDPRASCWATWLAQDVAGVKALLQRGPLAGLQAARLDTLWAGALRHALLGKPSLLAVCATSTLVGLGALALAHKVSSRAAPHGKPTTAPTTKAS